MDGTDKAVTANATKTKSAQIYANPIVGRLGRLELRAD
jgi:hypothetical protein